MNFRRTDCISQGKIGMNKLCEFGIRSSDFLNGMPNCALEVQTAEGTSQNVNDSDGEDGGLNGGAVVGR